jgi:1-deoxy-D-xylulose-5-phosphate synthase
MLELPEHAAVHFQPDLRHREWFHIVISIPVLCKRGYDQLVHDVALQNLHVIFCLDRGGLAWADGPTHHGAFDYAYLRCIPNMIVSAPMNEHELRNLMYTAQLPDTNGPFSIRYPER